MILDFSLLRSNKNFRNIFFAQVISSFGSQMTIVTVPYQVFHLTQSVFLTGLIGSVELVALALTVLYGGVLSDRYDRKKIMMICEALMIIGTLLLAFNASQVSPNLYMIFGLAFFLSALGGLHRPSIEALLPAVVAAKDMETVSSLSPLRNIITSILGPSIAGVILAHYGATVTYLIDTLTFILSIILLARSTIPYVKPVAEKTLAIWQEIIEGAKYLKQRKDILGTYAVDFCAMVFVSPQVLMPLIAKHFSADAYLGSLYAAPSIGAFLITIFSGWTKKVFRHGLAIALSAAIWAFCVGAVGMASTIIGIIILLALSGIFDMISGIFRMTVWNKTIPTSIRGRMASFEMLSYMSGPLLGQLFMGTAADTFGYQTALMIGCCFAIFLIVMICILLPEFVSYQDKKAADPLLAEE